MSADAVGDVVARFYRPLPVRTLVELGTALEDTFDAHLALAPGTEGATFDVVVIGGVQR